MNTIYGDTLLGPTLSGKMHGKNQTLVGIDNQDNSLVGTGVTAKPTAAADIRTASRRNDFGS